MFAESRDTDADVSNDPIREADAVCPSSSFSDTNDRRLNVIWHLEQRSSSSSQRSPRGQSPVSYRGMVLQPVLTTTIDFWRHDKAIFLQAPAEYTLTDNFYHFR